MYQALSPLKGPGDEASTIYIASMILSGATYYTHAYFGAGAGPIVMDDVRCTTAERRLIDCPFKLNHNCGHSEDAGVRCYSSTSGKIISI